MNMRNKSVAGMVLSVVMLFSGACYASSSTSQIVTFNPDGTSVLYDADSGEVLDTGVVEYSIINRPEEEIRENSGMGDTETETTTESETEVNGDVNVSVVGKYRTISDLNIRKEPNVESEKVGLLHKGDVVDVLSTSGDFWDIGEGYVSMKYLEKVEDASGEENTESSEETEAPTEAETESEVETESETEVAEESSPADFAELSKNSTIESAIGKSYKEKVKLYDDEYESADYKYNKKGVWVTVNNYVTENSKISIAHLLIRKPKKHIRKEKDHEGIFAVSMGYDEENTNTGWIVSNGEIERSNLSVGKELCLKEDGTFYSIDTSLSVGDEEGIIDTWSAVDKTLVVDGELGSFESKTISYPRTTIGMVEPGEYYVITSGKVGSYADITLNNLAETLMKLKCSYGRAVEGAAVRMYFEGSEIVSGESDKGNLEPNQSYLVIK